MYYQGFSPYILVFAIRAEITSLKKTPSIPIERERPKVIQNGEELSSVKQASFL